MTEIKPCPFCGGKAFLSVLYHEDRPYFPYIAVVLCSKCQAKCGSTGFSNSKEEAEENAIKCWNRRVKRHGQWKESIDYMTCSACYKDVCRYGDDGLSQEFLFCPHCGARMGGDAE